MERVHNDAVTIMKGQAPSLEVRHDQVESDVRSWSGKVSRTLRFTRLWVPLAGSDQEICAHRRSNTAARAHPVGV